MAGEQLRVVDGKEPGLLLGVKADLLIGRLAPEDHGRLGGDPEISRRHARISRGADRRLEIEDLGSTNGTFVNDERLEMPRTLEIGDVVRMGKTILRVTDDSVNTERESSSPTRASPREPPSIVAEASDVLVVAAGKAQGRRLACHEELVIGRGASEEGRLGDDLQLSRRHARVTRTASGQLSIEDLGSANGTFVNDERISVRRALNVGDVVRMGKTVLRVSRGGRSLEPPAAEAAPAPPAAASPQAAPAKRADAFGAGRAALHLELALGSVFAGCRVEEVISHGEMGIVYRADELALQRRVALKLILPEHSRDERFRERFRRESRIAAAIDHPNVIPIFDAGEENGVLYIMMRLVEGADMRALIAEQGRLEPLRAARIVRQVGAALDAAHARGMLHRDVKPANVLLGPRDHVYLTDFGLAKRATSVAELTRHGTIVARAGYVAPEQISNQHVDTRADVYALGCLLFEALTGEPPFARWTDGPAVLAHRDAPRPSVLDLRPDLPTDVDDVVRQAMARDPGERYPSAGDLGQAALLAAGGLRRSVPWSAPQALPEAHQAPILEHDNARRAEMVRWAVALAAFVIVAVAMVGALRGISTL